MAPFDRVNTSIVKMSLSFTVSEIRPLVYEIGASVTKNDLEMSFPSNTTVEIVAHV